MSESKDAVLKKKKNPAKSFFEKGTSLLERSKVIEQSRDKSEKGSVQVRLGQIQK